MPNVDRTHALTIKLTPDEREQLRTLAAAQDLESSKLVRRWLREAWAAHGGVPSAAPSEPKPRR